MDIKNFFSKIGAKKIYLALGGVLLVAIVAGAMFLPGTLFRGLITTQLNPGVITQLKTPLSTVCTVDRNPAFTNQEVTFTTTPAGGKQPYTYTWTSPSAATDITTETDPVMTTYYDHEGLFETRTYITDANNDFVMAPCDVVEVNDPSPLNVSCSADPNPAIVGQEVTWTATVSGGLTPYSYEWIDVTDTAVNGKNTPSVKTSYDTPTDEHGVRVVVTDKDGAQKGAICTVKVDAALPVPDPLAATCEVSPATAYTNELITFKANVSGGTKPYNYEWNIGQWIMNPPIVPADLTTAQITADFSHIEPGDFKFFLYVKDSSLTPKYTKADCIIKTIAPPKELLAATCAVNPSTIKSGDTVTWTASATGGDGTYSYLWTGDKIDGKTTKSAQATFLQKPLTDNFRVIVSSAGTTRTVTCPKLTFTTLAPPVTPPEEDEEEDSGEPSKCPGVNYPSDIEGHWAEDYIKKGYDYCLFKGVGGKFFPDRQATRIEAASMILYSKDKQPSSTCTTLACLTPFADLQYKEQGAILNPLYFESLIEGYPNNQFRPQSLITRAEAASLIVRAFFEPFGKPCPDAHCGAGWPDNFFLDITETWQGKYIRVLWDLRIMTGSGPNKVDPNRSITRAEMAKMIVLAYEETQ